MVSSLIINCPLKDYPIDINNNKSMDYPYERLDKIINYSIGKKVYVTFRISKWLDLSEHCQSTVLVKAHETF